MLVVLLNCGRFCGSGRLAITALAAAKQSVSTNTGRIIFTRSFISRIPDFAAPAVLAGLSKIIVQHRGSRALFQYIRPARVHLVLRKGPVPGSVDTNRQSDLMA